MKRDLSKLQKQLEITFRKPQLLKQAFTHSSYVNENRFSSIEDNERMEFLGDAVLELVVSEFLFKSFHELSEGELTKLRASIVCEPSLMKFAEDLNFGSYVLLGKGEESTGGRSRPALLADVFESFIGALFMDQGLDAAKDFLHKFIFPNLSLDGKPQILDYKTQLQELIQQDHTGVLEYRIVEEKGPAHEKSFISAVYINSQLLGSGAGRSKKEAEQQAASKALLELHKE